MKLRFFLSLLLPILACGCFHHHAPPAEPYHAPASPASTNTTSIVTPDNSLTAKVVGYNSVGRFVVLSFPVGRMAQTGQTFYLYRGGDKIGQIKITGPQQDNDTVADLVEGDAQVGDEVREQ
jgi:hypothetical protein